MTTSKLSALSFCLILVSLADLGCERSRAATTAPPAAVKAAETAPATLNSSKVTKIVFVGKKHACDCTRKSVDAGWAALQTALGTPPKLPIERFQVDTQGERVEPYRQQKPIMALPAIYFVDGKGAVTELLQGEVTSEQIGGVLNRK